MFCSRLSTASSISNAYYRHAVAKARIAARLSSPSSLQHRRRFSARSPSAAASAERMAAVVVFTTPGCPYCRRAKDALKEGGYPYAEVDVSVDKELRATLNEATGRKTVPQVRALMLLGVGTGVLCLLCCLTVFQSLLNQPISHPPPLNQASSTSGTTPQIYANGTYVGGSDDLLAKLQDGSFIGLMKDKGTAAAAGLPAALRSAVEQAAAAAQQAASSKEGSSSPLAVPPELKAVAEALVNPASGIAAKSSSSDKTFTGAQLLQWLQQQEGCSGGAGAAQQGASLLAANIVTRVATTLPQPQHVSSVVDSATYRLRSDAPCTVAWAQPLNTAYCECVASRLGVVGGFGLWQKWLVGWVVGWFDTALSCRKTAPQYPPQAHASTPTGWGPSAARPAGVVAEDLRGQILGLYDKHLSADGRSVNYGAMRQDPAFWRYVDSTAELQRVSRSCRCSACSIVGTPFLADGGWLGMVCVCKGAPQHTPARHPPCTQQVDLTSLSRPALMAFAINTYNALIIHTLVVHGTERYKTSTGRLTFFSKVRVTGW